MCDVSAGISYRESLAYSKDKEISDTVKLMKRATWRLKIAQKTCPEIGIMMAVIEKYYLLESAPRLSHEATFDPAVPEAKRIHETLVDAIDALSDLKREYRKFRFIRWLWPEIEVVATGLREYCWKGNAKL